MEKKKQLGAPLVKYWSLNAKILPLSDFNFLFKLEVGPRFKFRSMECIIMKPEA